MAVTEMAALDLVHLLGPANACMQRALALYGHLPAVHGREGFSLTIGEPFTGTPYITALVNRSPMLTDKVLRYHFHSAEKVLRLAEHPGHLSSWQSRTGDIEPETDRRYGGSIRTLRNEILIGASGFPEQLDEALAIRIAVHIGRNLMSKEHAGRIFEASNNPYRELFDEMA